MRISNRIHVARNFFGFFRGGEKNPFLLPIYLEPKLLEHMKKFIPNYII